MTKRLELKLFFSLKQLKKPKVLNGTHRFVEAETNSNFFSQKYEVFFETLEHESGTENRRIGTTGATASTSVFGAISS